MLKEMVGPLRWVAIVMWGLAALIAVGGGIAAVTSGEYEALIGVAIGAFITAAIGALVRYSANRIEAGDGPEMPVVIGYVFMTVGAAIAIGGVAVAFDDPGGFFMIPFGLVFVGAGYAAKRFFATPKGMKKVEVQVHEATVGTLDGRRSTHRSATIIHVDENATAEEIEAAKQAWRDEQLSDREDWAEGRILGEGARSGNLYYIGAGMWTVFALASLVAAIFWDEFFWFVTIAMAVFAALFWFQAIRNSLRLKKYGASHFVPERLPAMLGEELRGEIESGIAKNAPPKDGFVVTLRCVHRWEETQRHGSSSSDDRTVQRSEVLWEKEATSRGLSTARHDKMAVPVRFDLPADQPPTTLSALRDGISWQLSVKAAMPGLDYATSFDFPVVSPDVDGDRAGSE